MQGILIIFTTLPPLTLPRYTPTPGPQLSIRVFESAHRILATRGTIGEEGKNILGE